MLWSHTETFERGSRRSPPRCCSPGPSPRLPSRPGPASSPSPTTRSPTHSCTPGAGRVEVRLDFGADGIRLSVSDDGVGLPDDYAERGRGFRGMRADAERLGGRLIVETGGPMGERP